jgi:hypothetical protein
VSGCWTAGLPLYWANACVSYDIQQNASKYVPFGVASEGIATAFSKWTSTVCPLSANTGGRVSIDVRDFGPVECGLVQYNENGPNQHVIVFRDSGWAHHDLSNTLALTTVTYDTETGEIYDADMEINTTTQPLSTSATVPSGGYDFESIVTHETGHFLGMAHSTDTHATMYAHYTPGDEVMRNLTEDDVAGICDIYSPSGFRRVAKAASRTGALEEGACDPTPRHGFTTQCMSTTTTSSSPSCAFSRRASDLDANALAALGLAITSAVVRRRRHGRSGQSVER